MPEPTYTITITESERTALAKALGTLTTKLINAPVFVESPTGGTAQARAVLAPSTGSAAPPAAAAPSHAPVMEPRDRWARNRDGKEVPHPDGAEAYTVRIWKAEPSKSGTPRMKVSWPASTSGYIDANCFDQHLWPWLAAATKSSEPTTIYIVKKDKYKNIVGVRA